MPSAVQESEEDCQGAQPGMKINGVDWANNLNHKFWVIVVIFVSTGATVLTRENLATELRMT